MNRGPRRRLESAHRDAACAEDGDEDTPWRFWRHAMDSAEACLALSGLSANRICLEERLSHGQILICAESLWTRDIEHFISDDFDHWKNSVSVRILTAVWWIPSHCWRWFFCLFGNSIVFCWVGSRVLVSQRFFSLVLSPVMQFFHLPCTLGTRL